jgi:hypothetical protein
MALEQLPPCPVAELRRSLGGSHDVGEQHGGQAPIGLLAAAHPIDELPGRVEGERVRLRMDPREDA